MIHIARKWDNKKEICDGVMQMDHRVDKINFHDKDGFRAQEFQMTRLWGQ